MNYKKFNIHDTKTVKRNEEQEEEYKQRIKEYEDFVNSIDRNYIKQIFNEGMKLGVFKKKENGRIVTITEKNLTLEDIITLGFDFNDGYEYQIRRRKKPHQYTREELMKMQLQMEANESNKARIHQNLQRNRAFQPLNDGRLRFK